MKNMYTYCGVSVKNSDMHPGEVKNTPELKYYINMNIVKENNTFKKSKMANVHAIILINSVKCHIFVKSSH